jgi:hypothetical protein
MTSDLECTTENPVTSNIQIISVYPLLPVSVDITASENPIITGTEVIFTALPENEGDNPEYQWYVNDILSGINNYEFTYIPNNEDEIFTVLLSNEICAVNNPATSDTITMIVNTVSVQELYNSGEIKVYPIPTKDLVYINSSVRISQIQISDITGKIIYLDYTNKRDLKIDMSNWSNSIYYYKILTIENEEIKGKIIKF